MITDDEMPCLTDSSDSDDDAEDSHKMKETRKVMTGPRSKQSHPTRVESEEVPPVPQAQEEARTGRIGQRRTRMGTQFCRDHCSDATSIMDDLMGKSPENYYETQGQHGCEMMRCKED